MRTAAEGALDAGGMRVTLLGPAILRGAGRPAGLPRDHRESSFQLMPHARIDFR
jgi:hypothetical protein